ncbi:MAG: Amylo-alpha-1,6-glucosidase [Bacteroidetes bacterium ADurb.Bin408]|nr:MAG: Amylo-alpha-1,6-glucosidase [Bacteroidetes bacterium ADurb.Bin408]
MSYIQFDKLKLVNLEYALNKELLRTNRGGAFSSTTIIGCNTRKYHGLLICPQPYLDNENHILLSTLDETVIQREADFNLGIHKYQGSHYNPKGHKYIKDLNLEPIPKITYRVGGVILTKETLLTHEEDRTMLRYTLVEATSPTKLRFRPFLAFRNTHALSKANMYVNKQYEPVANGVSFRMYNGYTPLVIQFSKSVDYIHVPDWYYNIEYIEEMERGYEFQEDLYVPGYFEVDIKKGESIVISAGTEEITPGTLIRRFNKEVKQRIPRNSFENCLFNSAQQFIMKKGKRIEIVAGFPWYDRRGRDVFMALPGLTLTLDEPKLCKQILDSMIQEMNNGLFPNVGYGKKALFNAPDVSLWFFWALQEYATYTKSKGVLWRDYNGVISDILETFISNKLHHVKVADNALLYVKENGTALTWMDAYVEGKPVVPRYGFAVEINALWYNAVCFAIEVAELANDTAFVNAWKEIKEQIEISFPVLFYDASKKYLADCIDDGVTDWSIRPNQILAVSLPYSPINNDIKAEVLEVVRKKLLTPRGLRTLAPMDNNYKGVYEGNVAARETAAFQGAVYPWLLGHYCQALLNVYGQSALEKIADIYDEFEEVMWEHGIGSVSELYDGDPPHRPNGDISHATSVAELLRISKWAIQFKKNTTNKTDKVKA